MSFFNHPIHHESPENNNKRVYVVLQKGDEAYVKANGDPINMSILEQYELRQYAKDLVRGLTNETTKDLRPQLENLLLSAEVEHLGGADIVYKQLSDQEVELVTRATCGNLKLEPIEEVRKSISNSLSILVEQIKLHAKSPVQTP